MSWRDDPLWQAQVRLRTPERKLQEIRMAVALENALSKDEILTRYLNTVPFGTGTYGVAAAAQTYFGTTPDELTVPQAASLAALVNSPAALNPEQSRMRRCNTAISSSTAWPPTAWCRPR